MLPDIVGLLPMGGKGVRLGMPFPKPLAPTITATGIVPLYRHSLEQLRVVAATIYAIVNTGTDDCLLRALLEDGVNLLGVEEETLPGALGVAGLELSAEWGPDCLVAVALPDSIWQTRGRSLKDVLAARRKDGAVALFNAGSDELDNVLVEGDRVVEITTKGPQKGMGLVRGWGAFVMRAGALGRFTGKEKDGPQIGRADMGWAFLGRYADLGTPERYIENHDIRRWREQ